MAVETAPTPAKLPAGGGMFSRFERMVALRYLRSRRSDSFISIIAGFSFIGIALGVAVLIIVMSVMNGFRAELLDKILGLNGHIIVQGVNGRLDDFDAVTQRVLKVPGVTRAAPIVEGQVLASSAAGNYGVMVRGMRASDLRNLTSIADTLFDNQSADQTGAGALATPPADVSPGEGGPGKKGWTAHRQQILSRFKGDDAVIIGADLAQNLGLAVGDSIRLTSPEGAQTPFGVAPRSKAYRIVGLFKMGMSEYDSNVIFMPLKEAQAYFNLDNAVTAVEVMVQKPDEVAAYRTPIYDAVRIPARIIDWQQLNSSLFSALGVERNVMFLILTCIIAVAALNVISGLLMFVKDKGQDIAILRTMGASSGSILRIFFMAGASIGVFGTLGGLLLGTVFCQNIEAIREFLQNLTGTTLFDPTIYFLSKIPAQMDPHEVTLVVVIALALSFAATLPPAWRAARLDPVEALRYE